MFQKYSQPQSLRQFSTFRSCLVCALPVALLALAAGTANAQANLTFRGGSGSPLSITLAAPITYTVDVPVSNFPLFVFDAAAPTASFGDDLTGTLTYTINKGAPFSINIGGNGNSSGTTNGMTADDLYLFSSASSLVNAGDVVVLRAGTVTTRGSVTTAAPTSGTFATFLADGAGNRISPNATSATAPEPESLALLLTAIVPIVGLAHRRQKH